MASVINASSSGAGGLVSSGDSSGVLQLQNNGNTSVTLDTSGNVGIGTASPAVRLNVTDSSDGGNSGTIRLGSDGTYYGQQQFRYNSSEYRLGVYPSGNMTFYTKGSESMRIDSSGNLLVGRTSTVTNPASSGAIVYASSGYSTTDGTTTANYTKDRIYFNATNFYVLNGSSTGVVLPSGNTSWSSQSDERTKDIIEPIKNATQKLSDLRCVIGKYKTDDLNKRRVFLIAQDVLKVLPEAVTELDDKNKTLALSYNDIIPLLTAALQETKALIDTQAEELSRQAATINAQSAALAALTARVVALEGK